MIHPQITHNGDQVSVRVTSPDGLDFTLILELPTPSRPWTGIRLPPDLPTLPLSAIPYLIQALNTAWVIVWDASLKQTKDAPPRK